MSAVVVQFVGKHRASFRKVTLPDYKETDEYVHAVLMICFCVQLISVNEAQVSVRPADQRSDLPTHTIPSQTYTLALNQCGEDEHASFPEERVRFDALGGAFFPLYIST